MNGSAFERDLDYLAEKWGMTRREVLIACVSEVASDEGVDVNEKLQHGNR